VLQGWTDSEISDAASSDTLTGGAGNDTFVLGNASGNAYGKTLFSSNRTATVTDFQTGDVLRLYGGAHSDFSMGAAVTTDEGFEKKTISRGGQAWYEVVFDNVGSEVLLSSYVNNPGGGSPTFSTTPKTLGYVTSSTNLNLSDFNFS
jgi:Ca2+-binding RTX toxin-like protein